MRTPQRALPLVVTSLLAVQLLAAAPRAHAAPVTEADAFARLDADAPAYLLFRPSAETAVWTWLGKFDGMLKELIDDWKREIAGGYQATFGFDGTQGWAPSGLDPEAPIVASVLAVDLAAAEKAYTALAAVPAAKRDAKTLAKLPRLFLRTRVVASVLDPAKLKATLTAIAGAAGAREIHFALVDKGDTAALAAAFNADAKQGKAIAAALKKAKIVAVAAAHEDPLDSVILISADKAWLTIDVLSLYGGLRIDWKRDGAALAKLVARKLPKGGAQAALATGAGTALVGAGAGLWAHPGRLLDLGKVLGWNNVLHALAELGANGDGTIDLAALQKTGEQEVESCEAFRGITTDGAFETFALTLRTGPKAFELGATWGMRKAYALGAALITTDDGIVDLAAATDALALGALYLNGTAALRALPRPGILAKPPEAIYEAMRTCGFAAASVTGVFGWPQLLAVHLDQLAASHPGLQAVVEGGRNLAFMMKRLDVNTDNWIGAAVASFDPNMGRDPFDSLAKFYGKVKEHKAGGRQIYYAQPRSKSDPLIFAAMGEKVIYGLGWGGTATLDWFWGKAGPKSADPDVAPPFIGLARVDLPRTLKELGKVYGWLGPAAEASAKRMGNLSGSLSLQGDSLVGGLKLEIK